MGLYVNVASEIVALPAQKVIPAARWGSHLGSHGRSVVLRFNEHDVPPTGAHGHTDHIDVEYLYGGGISLLSLPV